MTRQPGPGDGYEDDGLFKSVMFGYDRAQVDEYVNAICDELHVLSVAVKELGPLEQELLVARKEVERLSAELAAATPGATASVRIQEMLRLAEDEGDRIRAEAHDFLQQARRDADEIRRAAEVDCEHVAAARRKENQRLREDILAGAKAEAARIMADATVRVAAPVTGASPTGHPLNPSPLNGSPVAGTPLNGSPVAGTPINGRPLNGNPVAGGPAGGGRDAAQPMRNSGPQKGGAAKKRSPAPLDGPAA